jgi:triacylglycerol lipase
MDGQLRDIAARVRAIGRSTAMDDILRASRIYASLQEREPYTGVRVTRDLYYGAHARHRLDVFGPEDAGPARPVLMFVHGGGFIGGDKKMPGSPFHDNVGVWAARNGLVGVSMTYRLAPEFTWPAGAEDVATAVAFLRGTIAAHGGDPKRTFLMGASAGAVHVAGYLTGAESANAAAFVRGAVLLSGIYDFTTEQNNAMLTAYIGTDPACFAERSVLTGLVESRVPLLVTLAELDPLDFERQALRLLNAYVARHGEWPNLIRLMGHSHFTSSLQLNTADDFLGRHLRAFIDRFMSS